MRRKSWFTGSLLLMCAFWLTPTLRAQDCDTLLTSTTSALGASGITGDASLCITDAGVQASLHAQGLVQGNAYTVWFVVFDNPANCGKYAGGTAGVCKSADAVLPSDNPQGAFGRMDSLIADGTGRARLSGRFRDLRLSHGAVVWLLMFGHGPAVTTDGRELARQLLTPQKPALGAPGLGATADTIQGGGVALAEFNVP